MTQRAIPAPDMKCSEFLGLLTDYLDNAIASENKVKLEEHLQWCPNCYALCNSVKRNIQGDRDSFELHQELLPLEIDAPINEEVCPQSFHRPPRAAEFLLLLMPYANNPHLLGDLEEMFVSSLLPRHGLFRARLWYWWQVVITMAPVLWACLRRVTTAALAWKLLR